MELNEEQKQKSVDELLESVRQLRISDAMEYRRLVDAILADQSLGLSKEALSLASRLGYETTELLDAVDVEGLPRTLTFLQREARKREAKQRLPEATPPTTVN